MLERCNLLPDGNKHVAISDQFVPVAHGVGTVWKVVAMYNDCLASSSGDVPLGGPDHSVDAAAGGMVDERINAVPIGVPAMEDVGLAEADRDVAVRVRGAIVLRIEGRAVDADAFVRREHFGWHRRQRRRRKRVLPVLDSLGGQQMLVRVLVSQNGSA